MNQKEINTANIKIYVNRFAKQVLQYITNGFPNETRGNSRKHIDSQTNMKFQFPTKL